MMIMMRVKVMMVMIMMRVMMVRKFVHIPHSSCQSSLAVRYELELGLRAVYIQVQPQSTS